MQTTSVRETKAKPRTVAKRASKRRVAAPVEFGSGEALGQLRQIRLDELKPSDLNVRKEPPSNIEALAASIDSHELIQNITVTVQDDGWGVVAGWRRVLALRLLVKQKKRSDGLLVPCRVIDAEQAVAISLAENVAREQMSAADEFEAWQRLVDQGQSIEAIAAAHGVTPVVISRRLRLANASPRLFAQFRGGELSLEQLMALAATTDHDLQEQVWDQCPVEYRTADNLRRRVKESKVAVNSPIGKFVGVKTYKNAGGALETDLFSDTNADRSMFADQALFQRLFDKRIQKECAKLTADGWKWVVYAESFYDATRGMTQVGPSVRDYSEADKAREAEIYRRLVALEQYEPGAEPPEDPALTKEWHEIGRMSDDEVQQEMNALCQERYEREASYEFFPDNIKALTGVILTIGEKGLFVDSGWAKPEDRAEVIALKRLERGEAADGGSEAHPQGDSDDRPLSDDQLKRPTYSDPLAKRLSSARTALIQSAMFKHPEVALRSLVLAMLAHNPICGFRRSEQFADAIQIQHRTTYGLTDTAPELQEFRTLREVEAKVEYWKARFAEEAKTRTLEESVFSLTSEELSELLTLLVALSIDAVTGHKTPAFAQPATALAKVLGVCSRDGWQPTASSYFNHIPKKQILSDVQEFSPDSVSDLSKLTKSALAQAAEKLAADTDWAPLFMRQ